MLYFYSFIHYNYEINVFLCLYSEIAWSNDDKSVDLDITKEMIGELIFNRYAFGQVFYTLGILCILHLSYIDPL